jgi:uncharacterized protein (TIGR03663 family)
MNRSPDVGSSNSASDLATAAAFFSKAAAFFWLGMGLAVLGALLLRLPQLDQRPMHTDESVQGMKFKALWDTNYYEYDRNEYHGPTLNYFTLPVVKISTLLRAGTWDEATLRLVPVLFGVGLILLLPLLRDGLGSPAVFWAALFTALSPAMAFYSRYYIHEMLLVFFTLLAMAAAWRYACRPGLGWACLAGAALGLMYATKETFVLNLAAAAIALASLWIWRWLRIGRPECPAGINAWHGLAAMWVALGIGILFFTSFFHNWQGLLDSIRTYLPWTGRAGGKSPHIHPWYYYLGLLLYAHQGRGPVWSEALIFILAWVGFARAMYAPTTPGPKTELIRFLALYTLVLTVIYACIPYKTPWCLLGFWQGMILLAGVGAATLVSACRPVGWKAGAVVILLLASAQLGVQAWRTCYLFSSDPRNPYVYVHTGGDLLELVDLVKKITASCPDPSKVVIKVMVAGHDYWPLPWYLRDYASQVGFYSEVPPEPQATVIIASSRFARAIQEKLGDTVTSTGSFGLRPKVIVQLLVQKDVWQAYLKTRQ